MVVLPRVSIAGLLSLIVVFALGLASLRFATNFWTTAASTVALACLLGAILGVFYLRDSARAFCAGFSLFGWVFLILVGWSWIGGQVGQDLTRGLSDLAEMVHPAPTPVLGTSGVPNVVGNLRGRTSTPIAEHLLESQRHYIKVGNFLQIGRLLLTLLFACLGGATAALLERWGRPDSVGPREEPVREP